MRGLFVLLAHLLTTLFKLCLLGGVYAVAAESLAIGHKPVSPPRTENDMLGSIDIRFVCYLDPAEAFGEVRQLKGNEFR